jgi:hypothetical protein
VSNLASDRAARLVLAIGHDADIDRIALQIAIAVKPKPVVEPCEENNVALESNYLREEEEIS